MNNDSVFLNPGQSSAHGNYCSFTHPYKGHMEGYVYNGTVKVGDTTYTVND
jgi:hypothetical protein